MDTKAVFILGVCLVVSAALVAASLGMQQQPETKVFALQSSLAGQGTQSERLAVAVAGGTLYAVEDAENARLLSVSGKAEMSAEAEKVDLYFSVETDSYKASDSQQENAEIVQNVRAALQAMGFEKEDIESTSYLLQERNEYDYDLRKNIFLGYRTTHGLKVSLTELEKAGQVIDAAIGAGANRVSSVVFDLKPETVERLKKEALELAGQKAREKAESIAAGLGISVGEVQSVSESVVYSTYRSYANDGMVMAEAAPVATEFVSGDIKVTANLNVNFLIS
jgi:hypothetical protein